jgi:hypothetical protein
MDDRTLDKDRKNVGGHLFEELFFEFIEKKYNISKTDLLEFLEEKQNINNSIPVSILRTSKLSSLEAIVKFSRENKKISYNIISSQLKRNPKALAVTYSVARRKMPERFPKEVDNDTLSIPFAAFSEKLSILECICHYLKSLDKSYAEISRLLSNDQRTVWTVCKRAEKKLAKLSAGKDSGNILEKNGR